MLPADVTIVVAFCSMGDIDIASVVIFFFFFFFRVRVLGFGCGAIAATANGEGMLGGNVGLTIVSDLRCLC